MSLRPTPTCFAEADPLTFNMEMIYCIILGMNRLTANDELPDPWASCRHLNGDVFSFVAGDVERLIERNTALALARHLREIEARKAEKGETLRPYTALHIIDGIIKDALMGTIGTLFGTCTGNSHSTNHMEGFIGMVVNEKLRRIYADLSLSLLPVYSKEDEEAMKP